MKKKFCFYLCIAQSIIILGLAFTLISPLLTNTEPQTADLVEYLSQFSEENNCFPATGYIADAKTAKVVGGAIIDEMTKHNYQLSNHATVKYDEENRLWLIEKGYLFGPGGFVIIDQDSGKVIKALKTKD